MSYAWLMDRARNEYSQFGEDGVVDAIFSVIKPANRWCFECGAADGMFFSNTRRLLRKGWDGILVEAEPLVFDRLVQNTKGLNARCVEQRLESLDEILMVCGAPADIDLVTIDVDGQDYYLFNSLIRFRPRVVIIEFSAKAAPDFIPERGGEGQAGLEAIRRLARGRMYQDIHQTWCNLILVAKPLDRMLDRPDGAEAET